MVKSRTKSLPEFGSLDDIVDFFDTHDLGEYLEHMPEANFEVDLEQKTHLFALDAELSSKLTEIAKARHVPAEVLINTWLREKLLEPTS
jgi:CopG antitoxin of type II toxin-antitoxin system